MYTDDPVMDAYERDSEAEEWLQSLPECEFCGRPIQDEYLWEIGEDVFCDKCMKEKFYKVNEEARHGNAL